MSTVLPSLGGNGWIKDPSIILTTMFANMLVAEHSQSTIYKDNIVSLPYFLAMYQDDHKKMVINLEEELTEYFGRVFNIVKVTVDYYDVKENSYKLQISVSITHNSKTYSLANSFAVNGGVLAGVLKEANA